MHEEFWPWLLKQAEDRNIRHGWGDISLKLWLEKAKETFDSGVEGDEKELEFCYYPTSIVRG